MTTVYLAVEVSRREIISRAFLSSRLARRGHDVFVFVSDFFDRTEWPSPGVYIGKNVLRDFPPHNLSYYEKMKRSGIDVWYHDEEGGLYFGEGPSDWERQLATRSDLSVLDERDKILAWGNYQAKYYKRIGVRAGVHVVGSVNFEMYRPEYSPYLSAYDEKQTGGAKDYVLFNGRFSVANGYHVGSGHIVNDDYLASFYEKMQLFNLLSSEGVVLYSFVGFLAELALRQPHLSIYLRPHPTENPEFYREIFSGLPNVRLADCGDAGSWIRRARCLVQNGCTTAIQADIAGKPVITFLPAGGEDPSTVPLPNEVGTIVRSREEAIQAVLNPPQHQPSGRWPLAISCLNTTGVITELLDKHEVKSEQMNWRSLARSRIVFPVDRSLRRIAYQFFPSKLAAHKMRDRFFDAKLFRSFPELVGIADQCWGGTSEVERYSRGCWLVRGM